MRKKNERKKNGVVKKRSVSVRKKNGIVKKRSVLGMTKIVPGNLQS